MLRYRINFYTDSLSRTDDLPPSAKYLCGINWRRMAWLQTLDDSYSVSKGVMNAAIVMPASIDTITGGGGPRNSATLSSAFL